MANPEHLAKLRQGVRIWNRWREEHPTVHPDLSEANISRARLKGANLCETDLTAATLVSVDLSEAQLESALLGYTNLRGASLINARLAVAKLVGANLRGADLRGAEFTEAWVTEADLSKADLREAELVGTNFSWSNLRGADLRGANLTEARFVKTDLSRANLTGCSVYGISAWNVKMEGTLQADLIVTPFDEPPIQVDNLEVAQFIYLLLKNEKIRKVIDTITSKLVLILGRFKPSRKAVLDAIREEIRKHGYLPVLFDFEKPNGKDLTGTISTLANMARFVIADLTDPSSVPHELAMIVPSIPVPIQTIILTKNSEYAMFADFRKRYHWVLKPHRYKSKKSLIAELGECVIAPAEVKAKQLADGKFLHGAPQ